MEQLAVERRRQIDEGALRDIVHDVSFAYEVEEPRLFVTRARLVCQRNGAGLPMIPESSRSSSGVTRVYRDGRRSEVSIVAGDDQLDLVFTVLHEMGHVIVLPVEDAMGRVRAHTKRFFRVAGELYAIYSVPLSYATWRDGQVAACATLQIALSYEAYSRA